MGAAVEESQAGERMAGLQVHLPALRHAGEDGCGDVRGIYDLIDIGVSLGMGFLHVAPVFDSLWERPEKPLSTGAFDPVFLDTSASGLEDLSEGPSTTGLGRDGGDAIQIGTVRERKLEALWEGFLRFMGLPVDSSRRREFVRFLNEEELWIKPYCLHALLADVELGQRDWRLWPSDLASGSAARDFIERLESTYPGETGRQRAFYAYVQWIASRQWQRLADYAALRGMRLMTDLAGGAAAETVDGFFGAAVSEPEVLGARARRLKGLFSMVRLQNGAGARECSGAALGSRGFLVFEDAGSGQNGLFKWKRLEPRADESGGEEMLLFGMDRDPSLRERWSVDAEFRARFDRRGDEEAEKYGAGALQELLRNLFFSDAPYVLVGYRDLVGGGSLPDLWSRYRVSVEDLLRYPAWEHLRRSLRSMVEESGRGVSRKTRDEGNSNEHA